MPDLLEEAKRLSITEAQYAEAHSQGFSDGVAYAELKADQEKAELVERLEQAERACSGFASAVVGIETRTQWAEKEIERLRDVLLEIAEMHDTSGFLSLGADRARSALAAQQREGESG